MLAAAVLAGGVAVSQAGINVSFGFPLPRVVISHPVPYCPAPVFVAQPYCAPRVVVRDYGYGYRDYWQGYGRDYGHAREYGHGREYYGHDRGYGHGRGNGHRR